MDENAAAAKAEDAAVSSSKTAAAAGWTTVAAIGNTVVSFIVFLVLARLLSPSEFGIVAVATVFVDILLVLSKGGLGAAIVQRPALDEVYADTAFWVSTALGIGCCAILSLSSFGIAYFFNMAALQPVLVVLSTTFIVSGLSGVHEGRLQRDFSFRKLAIRTLAANLVAGLVAVGMALAGFGVWSLVVQRVLAAVLTAALTFAAFPWVPRLRFHVAMARQQTAIGMKVLGANLLIIVTNRVHELIAAYFLSSAAVGMMRMAWRCIDLVSQLAIIPLATVALPAYSQVQGDPKQLEDKFVVMTLASAFIALPCFFGMAAVAPIMLPVVFGDQWATSAPVLQVLCLLGPAMIVNSFLWPLFVSVNRAGIGMGLTGFQLAIGTAASLVSASFGLIVMTITHVARAYAVWPFSVELARRYVGISPARVFGAVLRPTVVAVFMAVVVFGSTIALKGMLAPPLILAIAISIGGLTYAALSALLMPKIFRSAQDMILARFIKPTSNPSPLGTQT